MINLNGCGRKWSWSNLRHYPGMFLEGLSKTMIKVRMTYLRVKILAQELQTRNSSTADFDLCHNNKKM
jgi:hypothetical protein